MNQTLSQETITLEKVTRKLDQARLGPAHKWLLFELGLCWMCAAYGITLIGFLIGSIQTEWHVSTEQQGLVASAGLVGSMLGSILVGALSDRFGRRTTLEISVFWAGLFSILSALAWSYPVLLVLRVLGGFALGAILPVGSTLISEFSPSNVRGRLLVLTNGFWGLGGGVAALVSYALVAPFGWRAPLLFGGVGILCTLLAHFKIPESPRYLYSHGKAEQAWALAERFSGQVEPNAEPVQVEAIPAPKPVSDGQSNSLEIWSAGYAGQTAIIWLLWTSLNFIFQGVFLWLPTILVARGQTAASSFLFSTIIILGQIPGTLLAAWLADSFSRKTSLICFLLVMGVSAVLFGFASTPAAILIWGFLLAVCTGGAWGLAYPFTTELYPTRMRGTATGWATGFGRVGGIAAPLIIAALLQSGASTLAIFVLLSVVPVVATVGLIGIRHEATGRSLEEVSQ
jgi:MFS transporter, putative metabolite:H+ symporter